MLTIYDGLNEIRRQLEAGSGSLGQLYHRFAKAHNEHPVIWVWEGKGGNERRRAKYPEYKLKRQKPKEDMFRAIGVFQSLLENCSNTYQISVPGYEGDDVIYSLAECYRHSTEVFIFSTDKDLRQFFGPNVNGTPTELKGYQKEPIPDEYVRLYKTLVGDPSDNIKGVPKFGDKAFYDADIDRILDRFQQGQYHLEEYDNVKPEFVYWSQIPENQALIKTYWEIVGFYHVPLDVLNSCMKQGIYNPAGAQQILNRFMME